MLKGLIIGKFMPLTKGHIALIDFGLKNCDELIVAVCSNDREPIDGVMRYNWVKKYYGNNPRVRVVHLTDDLPDSSESSREISKIWGADLKHKFPDVNIIFASEKYGEYVAEYMKIQYKIFDVNRENVPISATKVRNNPYKYWDYIPDVVKHYFIKKVCIFGSDSCGKSTLTIDLSNYYKTTYVPEVARNMFEWSNLTNEKLNINHLEQFAKMQYEAVNSMQFFAEKVLFCDSDNLTTQIYSEVYCGQVTKEVKAYDIINYDLYLLLDIDTPYVDDGSRDLGDRRKEMSNRFKNALEERNRKYILINGSWEERFKKAVKAVDEILKGN